ncbi:MAG: ribbon-helix-helix domain-containing protein [Candidatus Wolfebacteria bacterium]|nr:ribbon-helix-helix domain-containing protein [Candidatus Wolfebacteria bacterium]
MKTITRNTAVISISLPKKTLEALEKMRRQDGLSRSAFINMLTLKSIRRQKSSL